MIRVGIVENPLDPSSWEDHQVEDVLAFLVERFGTWPATGAIYDLEGMEDWHRAAEAAKSGALASRDVTPQDEAGIEHLAGLAGPLLVTVAPAGPVAIIFAVVAVAVGVAASFLLVPKIPSIAGAANRQSTSPNNELSDRANNARPNGRIPDIFGTVRATPDLIAAPYKVFRNNKEVEVAYMCLGRGTYTITDVLDDTTPISQIEGASVEVFGPYTSPNSGSPSMQIGATITEELVTAKRVSSVNGQTMEPEGNSRSLTLDCRFVSPNVIEATEYTYGGSYEYGEYYIPTNLAAYFFPGDTLTVSVQTITQDGQTLSLSGEYLVQSVTATTITLNNPASSNSDWNKLDLLTGDATGFYFTNMTAGSAGYVGWYVMDVPGLDRLFLNFVALNGLYKDDGTNQFAASVAITVEVQPVNQLGVPTGAIETFGLTLTGSVSERETVAQTLVVDPTFTGRCRVRAKRTTPKDTGFKGSVVDEVKWRDAYAVAPVTIAHFGNVTTIFSQTLATTGALAVKDRKLNMLATRQVPVGATAANPNPPIGPSQDAADIIFAVCADPYIGGRTPDEVDYDQINATLAEVQQYFNADTARQFGFTFDDDTVSFEETVATIADTVFCSAYRQGSKIRLAFERARGGSVLLFNHRNIIPGTQERTLRFGPINDQDGVELDYRDPNDGAPLTIRLPPDRSAVSPRKIQVPAARSFQQAYWHAWRAYNKLRYQNATVQFDATQEAALVLRNDRVLVTDLTRPPEMEGEVLDQDGLVLTLSQPAHLEANTDYTIFLQHVDATVETLRVQPGADAYHVQLPIAPRLPLAVDETYSARAGYQIVRGFGERARAFLVAERSPQSNFTETVTAINYTHLYYIVDEMALWLPFDDGTAIDLSAWQRDGIFRGGAGVSYDGERGVVYSGNGNSWIELPDFGYMPSYTVAAWIKPTPDNGVQVIFGSAASRDRVVYVTDFSLVVEHNGNVVSVPLPLNGWTHVVVAYGSGDGSVVFYANGERIGDGILPIPTSGALEAFRANGQDSFVGLADELQVWRRQLSDSDVAVIGRRASSAGSDTYTLEVSPTEFTIEAELDGTVKGGQLPRSSKATYRRGGTDLSGFGYVTIATSNCTATVDTSGNIEITAITADDAQVVISAPFVPSQTIGLEKHRSSTTAPPENPVTIAPASSTTSSSSPVRLVAFTAQLASGVTATAYTWGVESVADGSAAVASGQGTNQASLRVVVDAGDSHAAATFYCDVVTNVGSFRATCTMEHTQTP